MFYKDIAIIAVIGCVINVTYSITILPPASPVICTYLTDCGQIKFACIPDNSEEVEWLNPNFEVIRTNDDARIYVQDNKLQFHNRSKPDEGKYTCRYKNNHNKTKEVEIQVNVDPAFIYSSSSSYYYEEAALLYYDKLINCSVNLDDVFIQWEYQNVLLHTNIDQKYSQNSSGLIIHNITEHDDGQYSCLVGNDGNLLNATIYLTIHWPPELLSEQNQTVSVNVSEQVVLNCTVSSSPDPVYNWSIPDTCSSCPHTNDDSVMIFTADITGSGEYVCEAGNEYDRVRVNFTVNILSKPIIVMESVLRIIDEKQDIILSCDIEHAYPPSDIIWSITTVLSDELHIYDNTSDSSDYQLHNNGSFEIYRRFLLEMGNITVMCLASNLYGSATKKFYLWDKAAFEQRETFTVHVGNITNCDDLKQDANGLRKELMDTLRVWFSDVCNCNGNNNLYTPQLTCLDTTTGSVTSTVRHDGDMTAQMLIDLAVADIHSNDPPLVSLPQHGWILFLNITDNMYTATSSMNSEMHTTSTNGESDGQTVIIIVSVTVACALGLLLILLAIGLIYGVVIHKRKKKANCSDLKPPVHIYEDVDKFLPLYEDISINKTSSNSSSATESKVVFEESKILPPGYSSSTMLQVNASKKSNKENLNDYQIICDKNTAKHTNKDTTKDTTKDTVDSHNSDHQEDDAYIHCK